MAAEYTSLTLSSSVDESANANNKTIGAHFWFSLKGNTARVGFCVRKRNTTVVRTAMFPFTEITRTLNPPRPSFGSYAADAGAEDAADRPTNCSMAVLLHTASSLASLDPQANSSLGASGGAGDDGDVFVWQAFSSPRVDAVGIWVAAMAILILRYVIDLLLVGLWAKFNEKWDFIITPNLWVHPEQPPTPSF